MDLQWSENHASQTAAQIFDFICSGFSQEKFWPTHPDEESSLPFDSCLYNGAAGTLWALVQISKRLNLSPPFAPERVIRDIHLNYLKQPDTGSVVPSYFLGESGILTVGCSIGAAEEFPQRLKESIRLNTRNPANEALWGTPGAMLAALRISDFDLYKLGADYLFETWIERSDGHWTWTQDLYGRISQYVGPAHGFFGNVHALLEGQSLLSSSQREALFERTAKVTIGRALRERGEANWPTYFDPQSDKLPMVQWCHGAPGIITSLRSFPKNQNPELERVLLEAGELVWSAGPLTKGIGLCHGTDGNGYAFLQLFNRTGDEKWLERARKFAMHAIQRRNGRYSLWTGEAGLALFLLDCIDGRGEFPSLDYV